MIQVIFMICILPLFSGWLFAELEKIDKRNKELIKLMKWLEGGK